jgi:hypothetical protein
MNGLQSERGAAMVLALTVLLLMTALGAVLVLTTSTETMIAGGFRTSEATRYAAEAAAERVLADLALPGDWNAFVDGSARSTFVDGAPGSTRTLPDGSTIDLDQHLNMANCQKTSGCSIAEMNAVTADRPWGANNPRWKLLAYAPLTALVAGASLNAPYYVVVLVGDDPAEIDGDPTRDGSDAGNPGSGIIAIRAEAFGPRGAFRAVELTLSRPAGPGQAGDYNDGARQTGVRILSWREVR